jgi:hypothetical protein
MLVFGKPCVRTTSALQSQQPGQASIQSPSVGLEAAFVRGPIGQIHRWSAIQITGLSLNTKCNLLGQALAIQSVGQSHEQSLLSA